MKWYISESKVRDIIGEIMKPVVTKAKDQDKQ